MLMDAHHPPSRPSLQPRRAPRPARRAPHSAASCCSAAGSATTGAATTTSSGRSAPLPPRRSKQVSMQCSDFLTSHVELRGFNLKSATETVTCDRCSLTVADSINPCTFLQSATLWPPARRRWVHLGLFSLVFSFRIAQSAEGTENCAVSCGEYVARSGEPAAAPAARPARRRAAQPTPCALPHSFSLLPPTTTSGNLRRHCDGRRHKPAGNELRLRLGLRLRRQRRLGWLGLAPPRPVTVHGLPSAL